MANWAQHYGFVQSDTRLQRFPSSHQSQQHPHPLVPRADPRFFAHTADRTKLGPTGYISLRFRARNPRPAAMITTSQRTWAYTNSHLRLFSSHQHLLTQSRCPRFPIRPVHRLRLLKRCSWRFREQESQERTARPDLMATMDSDSVTHKQQRPISTFLTPHTDHGLIPSRPHRCRPEGRTTTTSRDALSTSRRSQARRRYAGCRQALAHLLPDCSDYERALSARSSAYGGGDPNAAAEQAGTYA